MYKVYCLISQDNPKFHYYGFTSNLESRLKAHYSGKVRTTRRFRPVKLLGYIEFINKEDALRFEKNVKTKASYRKRFLCQLNSEV